jgi:hypothetical protein
MRQLIWGLITVLMAYGGWQFLRALRADPRQHLNPQGGMAGELDLNLDDDLFNYTPSSAQSSTRSSSASPADTPVFGPLDTDALIPHEAEAGAPGMAPAVLPQGDNAIDSFALELELQRMRREIGSLREVVEANRREIESLHTELERATFRPKPAAADFSVSPEYDEALALARRGLLSSEIAARCGITRAEAELVASLAARGREPERKLS